MNILLTGGTGLVGSQLGIELVQLGHKIYSVSRSVQSSKINCPFPAENLTWNDLKQISDVEIDVVIHLAGESVSSGIWTDQLKEKIKESRVGSTKRLLEFFQKAQRWPKVWINASAVGFYGDRGDEELDENSSAGAGFLAEVCKEWEQALAPVSQTCRLVYLRFGVILSRRQGVLGALMPAFRFGFGGPLGTGKQWMSWIHEDDCRDLIRYALAEDSISGVVNAVSPTPVTNKEFTTTLNQVLGKRNFLSVPKFLLSLLGELSTLFSFSQKVLPKKALSKGFKFKYRTLSSALQNLLDYQSKSGVFEIYQTQFVPMPKDEVFKYFCDEKNLETLTPEMLKFKVVGKSSEEIEEGTLIDYKLRVRGLPIKWQSQILSWRPGEQFVDTQLKGPYSLWHHTHNFENLGTGTLMTDRVLFKVALWPLSVFVFPLVQGDIKKIFSYRRQTIYKLFVKRS